jgi:hypothetical protein
MSENIGITLIPEAALVFPDLFEAKAFMRNGKPQGEPKFGGTFLIPLDSTLTDTQGNVIIDVAGLKAVAVKVADAKWPGRNLGELNFPFKDGDKEAARVGAARAAAGKKGDSDFYKGNLVLKTSSKFQPAVLGGAEKQPIIDPSKIYSGVIVTAEVNFVTYNKINPDAKDGVTAYLNSVLVIRDGSRIAGRDASQSFSGIGGGSSNYDPTAGAGPVGGNAPVDEIQF